MVAVTHNHKSRSCFALPRVDTTVTAMSHQTDSFTEGGGNMLGNLRNIPFHANGSEVDTFFGCWLDINQPFQPGTTKPNNVLPLNASGTVDGPFTDSSNPPKPIGQAIMRNLHQCLVAEVAFDPITIPLGVDPSNWDKLAQRNLAWSDAGSAQAVTNFEIRPTSATLPPGERPDELMIDWNTTPIGSVANLYLPSVTSDQLLAMASRMYTFHRLQQVDDHTISTETGGVTYVPVPPGQEANLAGCLYITLPNAMPRGRTHNVVVRQLTNAFAKGRQAPQQIIRKGARAGGHASATGESSSTISWRKVIGAFQLSIPVRE